MVACLFETTRELRMFSGEEKEPEVAPEEEEVRSQRRLWCSLLGC